MTCPFDPVASGIREVPDVPGVPVAPFAPAVPEAPGVNVAPRSPMVLYEDTRQQAGKHKNIHIYCRRHGIEIIRQALNVGDYQVAGRGSIAVDTKMSVLELAGNIFQDHARFRAECLRAQRCGIRLIILTEESLPGGSLENWRPPVGRDGLPRSRVDPKKLCRAMRTMQEKDGVAFRFCDGRSTARELVAYLTGAKK